MFTIFLSRPSDHPETPRRLMNWLKSAARRLHQRRVRYLQRHFVFFQEHLIDGQSTLITDLLSCAGRLANIWGFIMDIVSTFNQFLVNVSDCRLYGCVGKREKLLTCQWFQLDCSWLISPERLFTSSQDKRMFDLMVLGTNELTINETMSHNCQSLF